MEPDKIYIPIVNEEGKRLISTIWWPEDNRTQNEKTFIDTVEYLRKDALLEWAKEKQEQMKIEAGGCSNMLAAGKFLAFKELIEKLEKL